MEERTLNEIPRWRTSGSKVYFVHLHPSASRGGAMSWLVEMAPVSATTARPAHDFSALPHDFQGRTTLIHGLRRGGLYGD